MAYTDNRPRIKGPLRLRTAIWVIAVSLATIALSSAQVKSQPNSPTIHYVVRPVLSRNASPLLKITVRFAANSSGKSGFGWEDEWAGETRLWQFARNLTVDGAATMKMDKPGHWTIIAPAGAALTVRYDIVSAYDHDPTAKDINQAWPIIRPTWIESIGHSLFGRPDGDEHQSVSFDLEAVPAGLKIDSDLLHLPNRDRTRAGTGDLADITDSVIIGGYELKKCRDIKTGTRLAAIGAYSFTPAALFHAVNRVVEIERAFWLDRKSKPFLATVIPIQKMVKQVAYAGTGLGDAFALRIGSSARLDEVIVLLAHEYFHHWNPALLAASPAEDAAAEQRAAWFGEGFTDYYAYQLPYRNGLITETEWRSLWNRKLLAYARSPLRTSSNRDTAALYWASSAGTQIPYQRGAMLAALWDWKLRVHSGGRITLDDVMRAQRKAAATSADKLIPLFERTMTLFGIDASRDITDYIDHGEQVIWPTDVFGPCVTVATWSEPVFAAGFDVAASRTSGSATGVDASGPAYAAGLRNGMKIVIPDSDRIGNPMKAWTIEITEEDNSRMLSYLPQGLATIPVQEIMAPSSTQRGKRCTQQRRF